MSQIRQNYHIESEEGVNKQINLELYAMYTYLSLVWCHVWWDLLVFVNVSLFSHPTVLLL